MENKDPFACYDWFFTIVIQPVDGPNFFALDPYEERPLLFKCYADARLWAEGAGFKRYAIRKTLLNTDE